MLRDGDLCAAFVEIGDDVIAVECLVGDQAIEFDTVNEGCNADRIEPLPLQQNETHQIAQGPIKMGILNLNKP